MDDIYVFLLNMNWWQWLSFGIAFLSIELMFPGVFMLWFGISAVCVSFFVFILNFSGFFPVLLFLFIGIISSFVGFKYQKKIKANFVNNIEKKFVGKTIVLHNSIEDGIGREKIENSYWTIKGQDLQKGEKAIIVAVEGNSFIVEKVN